jgi:hypothetical protein
LNPARIFGFDGFSFFVISDLLYYSCDLVSVR